MALLRITHGQLVALVLLLALTAAAMARVDAWASHRRPNATSYGGQPNSSHHFGGGYAFPNRTAGGWGAHNQGGLSKIPLQMPGPYGGGRNGSYVAGGYNYHNASRPQAPAGHPYGNLFH